MTLPVRRLLTPFAAAVVVCGWAADARAQRPAPPTTAAPRAATPVASPASTADKRTQSTTLAAQAPFEYRLNAGDKLRIEVYRDPQLSQSVQVRPDGKITLPLIGDLDASGKTPVELRDALQTALKEYVNNPVVTVIVVEATSAQAHVMGEVNHQGPVTLQGNMTVVQALALAGGLTDWANASNIRILRNGPTGLQTITFNYKKFTEGSESPIAIKPGDTIVVAAKRW
jgi:polysaccharide export outer membrane protein